MNYKEIIINAQHKDVDRGAGLSTVLIVRENPYKEILRILRPEKDPCKHTIIIHGHANGDEIAAALHWFHSALYHAENNKSDHGVLKSPEYLQVRHAVKWGNP